MPGDAADARRNLLDCRHQWKGQQHGPADAVAELRARLAVGADAGRVIVGRAGDQARAERFDQPAKAEWLARFRRGCVVQLMRRMFGFWMVRHARSTSLIAFGSRRGTCTQLMPEASGVVAVVLGRAKAGACNP